MWAGCPRIPSACGWPGPGCRVYVGGARLRRPPLHLWQSGANGEKGDLFDATSAPTAARPARLASKPQVPSRSETFPTPLLLPLFPADAVGSLPSPPPSPTPASAARLTSTAATPACSDAFCVPPPLLATARDRTTLCSFCGAIVFRLDLHPPCSHPNGGIGLHGAGGAERAVAPLAYAPASSALPTGAGGRLPRRPLPAGDPSCCTLAPAVSPPSPQVCRRGAPVIKTSHKTHNR